eukprot:gene20128-26859_t
MLRFILIATYLWGLSVPALATRGHFIKDQRPAVGIVDGNYDDADGEFELLTQVWDDFVMSQSDPDPGFDSGAYDMVDLQPDDNENGNFDAALASVESFLGGAEVMTMQRLILPLPEDYNAEEAEEEVIEELAALHAASKLKVEIKEEEFGDEEDAKDISTMPGEEREFVQEIVFRGHFDAGGQEADFTILFVFKTKMLDLHKDKVWDNAWVDLQPDDDENGNFDAALVSVGSFLVGAEAMTMQTLNLPLPKDYNAEEAEEEVIEELAVLQAALKLKAENKKEEIGVEEDAEDISTMPVDQREFVQDIFYLGQFDAGGQEAGYTVRDEGLHPTPVLLFGSGQPHNQVPTISTSYVTNIFFSRPSQGAILAHGNAVMDHLTLATLLLMTVAMIIFFMHTFCEMRGGASGLSSLHVVLERSGEDRYVLVRGTAGLKLCAHYVAELDAKA